MTSSPSLTQSHSLPLSLSLSHTHSPSLSHSHGRGRLAAATPMEELMEEGFISHNVLVKRFYKVNSSTKSSTYCLLLLIKTIS